MKKKECLRCGKCCSNFSMTKKQVIRILEYLRGNPKVLDTLLETPEVKDVQDACVFLRGTSGNTHCTIYSARPEICRIFGVAGEDGLECPEGTVTTEYTLVEVKNIIHDIYYEPQISVGRYEDFFRTFIRNVPRDSVQNYLYFFEYYIKLLKS